MNRNHKHKRQKTAQNKEAKRIAAANKWQSPEERPEATVAERAALAGTTLAEKAALFVPRKSKPKPPPPFAEPCANVQPLRESPF